MNANSSAKNKTIGSWLRASKLHLERAGIGTARLDCLVLLEDVLNTNRTQLLAEPTKQISHEQILHLNSLIKRRAKHEPLAYIRGKTEFYGRQFAINKHVLEPRPETETTIDLMKKLPFSAIKTVVDVGTGSGAIAITLKLEIPTAEVLATDIDPNCLKIAKENADTLKANVEILKADLLGDLKLPEECVVLANLPYVPDDHQINQAAMNEPRLAIFGGPDGLDLYRQLFSQLKEQPVSYVLTEALPFQHQDLATIAQQQGYKLINAVDFIQVFSKAALASKL